MICPRTVPAIVDRLLRSRTSGSAAGAAPRSPLPGPTTQQALGRAGASTSGDENDAGNRSCQRWPRVLHVLRPGLAVHRRQTGGRVLNPDAEDDLAERLSDRPI